MLQDFGMIMFSISKAHVVPPLEKSILESLTKVPTASSS